MKAHVIANGEQCSLRELPLLPKEEVFIEEKELAFLEELRKYESKWVAISESDGAEIIVGSGKDAVEATAEAEAKCSVM
ncbi:MAG TPA: hypothetical protein VHU19_16555 [Pyrinomonadaceae bacterium]|jgi:hypothetical protein|nr:hypothetical protein [Pyrinomonadaceae bacterium]